MRTGFFHNERCMWHGGGNYALTLPVEGLVQPIPDGYPDSPETKRRLRNLLDVTGLIEDLDLQTAEAAMFEDLRRVHPQSYLQRFKSLSDQGGGELGPRAPFGAGGYEIAALSAGLVKTALTSVLQGRHHNAYALSRPPGHHCLPETPNGFCLLANIAIAVEAAFGARLTERVAVVDWDVHHGNGTEAVFYDREDVLTISIHQERNYPMDSGDAEDQGAGAGEGANMNIPLPPGAGHRTYLEAMERLVIPALQNFDPDCIIIACGFDASAVDPLGRMLASAETFREMTRQLMEVAEEICDGRIVAAHEGGYSAAYVPFCGHAVLEEMSGSAITAPDPMADTLRLRQPSVQLENIYSHMLSDLEEMFF